MMMEDDTFFREPAEVDARKHRILRLVGMPLDFELVEEVVREPREPCAHYFRELRLAAARASDVECVPPAEMAEDAHRDLPILDGADRRQALFAPIDEMVPADLVDGVAQLARVENLFFVHDHSIPKNNTTIV